MLGIFMLTNISCTSEFNDTPANIDLSHKKEESYIPKLEHPGILHTTESIERMRTIAKRADSNTPAYQAYLKFKNDSRSQSNYTIRGPFEIIARDGDYAYTKNSFESDFAAAHMNALMWAIDQDEAHAQKSLEILLAYANKLKSVAPSNDAPLLAGFEAFRITFALEILKHTYGKITKDDSDKIDNMLKTVFMPVIENFYNTAPYTNGNWGLVITRAYISMAILWDDTDMYKKAVETLLQGNDNGTIPNYINQEGQCQESGRDQAHAQLGIGVLGSICEIAYKQGNDLYGVLENRLLKGYEYTAKYNLGYDDLPFVTWKDVTGKYSNWKSISDLYRGEFRSIYALAYNHYVTRKGLEMPFTAKVLEKHPTGKYDGDGIDYDVFQFCDENN